LKVSGDETDAPADDDELMELVLDPDLLEEIQRVRDAEGC
jgi:hypothetical protein